MQTNDNHLMRYITNHCSAECGQCRLWGTGKSVSVVLHLFHSLDFDMSLRTHQQTGSLCMWASLSFSCPTSWRTGWLDTADVGASSMKTQHFKIKMFDNFCGRKWLDIKLIHFCDCLTLLQWLAARQPIECKTLTKTTLTITPSQTLTITTDIFNGKMGGERNGRFLWPNFQFDLYLSLLLSLPLYSLSLSLSLSLSSSLSFIILTSSGRAIPRPRTSQYTI